MGCTMGVAKIKAGDHLKEFDPYGSEDDENEKSVKKPFKNFGLGKGRGHRLVELGVIEPKKKN